MEITARQLELIEAASKILTASGINGLTIKNLAKEMNFSESAIYRHFTSKEEIILGMLGFLAESIDVRLSAIPHTTNPEENFRAMFQEQFEFFSNNPHYVVAVFSDGLMDESLRINEAIMKLLAVKMKYLFPLISDGQEKNIFTKAISTEELVSIVMGTFKLQMYKWRLFSFEFDLKESGCKMIDSLLTLIKTK
jgi:AcrR family transcriptional regulator